jgi:hypothetical protein
MALTIFDIIGALIDNSSIGGRQKGQLSEAVLTLAEAAGTPVVPVDPAAPLEITAVTLPAYTAGTVYSASLTATGGTVPVTWRVAGLPAGVSASDSGVISGTPTVNAGVLSLTAIATDSSVPAQVTVAVLPLAVA